MKKIKFLNGIKAMFACAVIALAGSLALTSCEKADLDATFEAGNAVISFNVKVFDLVDGDVTSQATVTGAETITHKGNYPGGKVTISATYKDASASQEVTVNPLAAGGKATYNVTLVTSSTKPGEPSLVVVAEVLDEKPLIGELEDAHHAHGEFNWALNDNEYILIRDVEYDLFDEGKILEVTGDLQVMETLSKGMAYNNTKKATLEMKISAWAYYRAWTTKTTKIIEYTVKYDDDSAVIGSVVVETVTSVEAQWEEAPYNNHYHKGHGHGTHDHGHGGNNAGGGIIYAD